MEATLRVLNELVAEGAIERYAIGGAFGALFYLEPFLTQDLDVFCLVPSGASLLMPFARTYDSLKVRGYQFEGEFIMVEGVPVQLLPATTPLEIDALMQALPKTYRSALAPVMRPEHLLAISLQTGRDKDFVRVALFCAQVADLDVALVRSLVARFALADRLAAFERRYPDAAKRLSIRG